MKLHEIKIKQVVPGTGTGINVIDGELNAALREFKKQVKESDKLKLVFQNKFYVKPSDKKRKMVNEAKYLQKIQSDKEKL